MHTILENRHTGMPTIIREMKKSGLPEPEFIEERACFKVILKNRFSEQFIMIDEDDRLSKQLKKTAHQNSSSKLSEESIKTQAHKAKVLGFVNVNMELDKNVNVEIKRINFD